LAPLIVAGLGNPGSEYELTRHNLGFVFADNVADDFRKNRKCSLLYCRQERYSVIKPMTFMNRSGAAIKCFLDYYGIAREDLLVVCDDFNLPLGKIRLRPSGSSGGHNGLQSVMDSLQSSEFARLRIGIGGEDVPDKKSYVLERFNKREIQLVGDMMIDAQNILDYYLNNGIAEAMNRYN
jgi:PTH1 family peptidyl-tRNA hydrolase